MKQQGLIAEGGRDVRRGSQDFGKVLATAGALTPTPVSPVLEATHGSLTRHIGQSLCCLCVARCHGAKTTEIFQTFGPIVLAIRFCVCARDAP